MIVFTSVFILIIVLCLTICAFEWYKCRANTTLKTNERANYQTFGKFDKTKGRMTKVWDNRKVFL